MRELIIALLALSAGTFVGMSIESIRYTRRLGKILDNLERGNPPYE